MVIDTNHERDLDRATNQLGRLQQKKIDIILYLALID